jgi:tetratricopeptide (TPR) repeat protein
MSDTSAPGLPDDFTLLQWTDLDGPILSAHNTACESLRALKYSDAVLQFTAAIEASDSNAVSLMGRARCWQLMDQHRRALDDLSVAIDREHVQQTRRRCRMHLLRASSYVQIKRTDLALREYDLAQGILPWETSIYSGRANLFMQMQQFDAALQNCQLALKYEPKNYLAYQYLGIINAQLNQLKEAIQAFDSALEIQPHYETYILRGKAHSSNNDMPSAMKDFTSAVELKPNLPLAYGNRAALYAQMRDTEKAIDDASNWIQKCSAKDSVSAHHARGVWLMELERFEEAIEDFTQVLKLDAKHLIARFARATAYFNLNDHDKAIEDWNIVLQLQPQFAKAYLNIGEAYAAKKDYGLAVKFYTEALRIEKKDQKALFLLRAKAYSELCMRQHAIYDLSNVLRFDAKDVTLYHQRAYEYYHLGQIDKALLDLNTALNINPYIPETYEKRATLFHKLHMPNYGRTDLLQAKRIRRKYAITTDKLTKDICKIYSLDSSKRLKK